jgi:hypothetical protein
VLLDIGTVFAGIGVAVVGFVVVVVVCVVILRLLNALLPSYDDRSGATPGAPVAEAPGDAEIQEGSAREDPAPEEPGGSEASG